MADLITLRGIESRFAQIPNEVLEDPDLSWKAKGLWSYLQSRGPDWKAFRADLTARATDGKAAVATAVRELQERGYLRIEELDRDPDSGQIQGTRWHLLTPHTENRDTDRTPKIGTRPHPDFPCPDNPCPDNPGPENRTHSNTKYQYGRVKRKNNTEEEAAAAAAPAPAPAGEDLRYEVADLVGALVQKDPQRIELMAQHLAHRLPGFDLEAAEWIAGTFLEAAGPATDYPIQERARIVEAALRDLVTQGRNWSRRHYLSFVTASYGHRRGRQNGEPAGPAGELSTPQHLALYAWVAPGDWPPTPWGDLSWDDVLEHLDGSHLHRQERRR